MEETHISDDQLVLFYYGEASDSAPVEQHLAECEHCRAEYRALQTVLNTIDSAPVPDRGPEYGSAVWQRIHKRVGGRRSHRLGWFPWWMWAPAAAALLLLAFFAGRISRRPEAPTLASGQVRERILLVAVGDHLERSQMVSSRNQQCARWQREDRHLRRAAHGRGSPRFEPALPPDREQHWRHRGWQRSGRSGADAARDHK